MESFFEVSEWPLSPTRLQRAYDTLAGRRRFLRIYPFLLQSITLSLVGYKRYYEGSDTNKLTTSLIVQTELDIQVSIAGVTRKIW